LGLKLLPLLARKVSISKIVIEQPDIEVVIDETAAPAEDSDPGTVEVPATGFDIDVNRFEIRNAHIVVNRTDGTRLVELSGLNETLSAKASGNGDLTLSGTTTLDELRLDLPAGTFGDGLRLKLEKTIAFDAGSDVATIEQAVLDVAGVPVKLTGSVSGITDRSLVADLTLDGGPGQVAALIGLIPSSMLPHELTGVTSNGTLRVSGKITGPLTAPEGPDFDIALGLTDGTVQVPGMAQPITDIRIDLTANPDVVNVRDFGLDTGRSKVQGSSLIRDYRVDPRFEASVDADVALEEIPFFVAGAETLGLGGRMNGSLQATGIASKPDAVALNGTVGLDMVSAMIGTMPEPITDMVGRFVFNKQRVTLESFRGRLGRGSFSANGTLDDPMALDPTRTDGARARANVNITSPLLDVDAMMPVYPAAGGPASTETAVGATAKRNIPELPPIDGRFTLNAQRMFVNGAEAKASRGTLQLERGIARLEGVSLDIFDGNIAMTGEMNLNQRDNPPFDLALDVTNCSVKELFTFNRSLDKMAMAADHVRGRMTSTSEMTGALNDTLGLDIPTLISEGNVQISQVRFSEYPVQQALENYFQSSRFKSMEFNDFIQKFRIENGRLLFDKIMIRGDGYGVVGTGWSSMEGGYEMALDLELPQEMAQGVRAKMPDLAQSALFRPGGGSLIVPVKVSGSRGKAPKVVLDSGRLTDIAKQKATSAVKGEVDKAKEEVAEAATGAISDILGGADADSTKRDLEDKAKEAMGGAIKGLFGK
jgi:hypothetical protein